MPYVGLGQDEESPAAPGITDLLSQITAGWDWHEWALAGIGAYLVVRTLFRGARSTSRAVTKKTRKVGSSIRRRKRALKTVFTG